MAIEPLSRAALILLLACAAAAPSAACEKRVRRHPDPLVLERLPNGELSGPQFETVKEALRRLGCRAKPVELPWARALSDLQSGELDILPGAHRRPEREAYALFSQSVWPSRNRLFMRSNDPRRSELADLQAVEAAQLRLGLQTGVSYGPALDALLARGRLQVMRAPNRQGLWQMLARGRVDAVPADELASLGELRRLGLQQQLQASAIGLGEEPSRTAFSRKTQDADFVARFDEALLAMQRDGSLAAIEQRFRELLARRPLNPPR